MASATLWASCAANRFTCSASCKSFCAVSAAILSSSSAAAFATAISAACSFNNLCASSSASLAAFSASSCARYKASSASFAIWAALISTSKSSSTPTPKSTSPSTPNVIWPSSISAFLLVLGFAGNIWTKPFSLVTAFILPICPSYSKFSILKKKAFCSSVTLAPYWVCTWYSFPTLTMVKSQVPVVSPTNFFCISSTIFCASSSVL